MYVLEKSSCKNVFSKNDSENGATNSHAWGETWVAQTTIEEELFKRDAEAGDE